ncbi:MAG: aspartate dehydrogenase domain-containing protein [Fimbriimonadales bacterium]
MRVAVWGLGNVGTQIVEASVRDPRLLRLVAILARANAWPSTDARADVPNVETISQLGALGPDVVVETASAAALAEQGHLVLEAGIDLLALSCSALCDPAVEERLGQAATRSGSRLLIAPAAGLGTDFLRAAQRGQLRRVRLTVFWGPSPEMPGSGLQPRPSLLFKGSAREAGLLFPRRINFGVGIALAGLGLDATEVRCYLDARATHMRYRLQASATMFKIDAAVESLRPDGRRGRLAALSAIETLRNLAVEKRRTISS